MKCRFCNYTELIEVIDLGHQPMSNSFLKTPNPEAEETYPLVLYRCANCGLVQIEKCKGFSNIFSDEYIYYSSDSPSNVSHAKEYCDMMMSALKPKTVMEIGSNDGYMLQHFMAAGCDVFGVDPSGAADRAKQRGIPTGKAMFDIYYARQLKREFDLICGINVLNHQPYINDFVSGLKTCLAPKGIVTFEFPSLYDMLTEVEFDTIYHEHLNYYSLQTITKIFTKHGLDIFHAEKLPTHGGSYRIYARHDTEDDYLKTVGSSEYQAINKEEAGHPLEHLCSGFKKRILYFRESMRNFVGRMNGRGDLVAAYGAAAKVNTLFNFCGFDKYDIAFVVDRSPHKIGKFLPGSHIPVVSEDALKELNPKYVILSAWNLADEITKQLSYISEWDGRLVRVSNR